MHTVVSVSNLSKSYHLYKRNRTRLKEVLLGWTGRHYYHDFKALDNVSLDVAQGECVGIVGRNGSGKSTLLQIVAGTLTPSSGNVMVKGRLTALLELGAGFAPDYTGRENINLYSAILGMKARETREQLDEIIDFADIGEYIDQPVRTYSSGMYVRLAFAVNACIRPDVLIIDEALSVGDMPFQAKCFKYLQGLSADGTAILFVSHNVELIKNFCSRAVWLMDGKVNMAGAARDVAQSYYDYGCLLAGRPPLSETVRNFPITTGNLALFQDNGSCSTIYSELVKDAVRFKKNTDSLSVGSGDVCIRNVLFTGDDRKIKTVFAYGENITVYVLIEATRDMADDLLLMVYICKIENNNVIITINNANNLKKLFCKAGEFRILSLTFPVCLTHGGYYCNIGIKSGIEGSLFSELGIFDSNRQIWFHSINRYMHLTVLPAPIAFPEDVFFMRELTISSLADITGEEEMAAVLEKSGCSNE